MLRLDPSIIPDPSKPQKWDAYGTAPGRHEFIVADVFVSNAALYQSIYVHSGETRTIPADDLALVLASLGLQPTGRMTDEPLPVGPRIESGEAFHAHVEPGSFHEGVLVGRREALDPVDGGLCEPEHRRLARMFGPLLRSLREKHGVGLGRLARALGCQTAALSAFELGERPGDKQPAGTSEMDRLIQRSLHPAGRCTCVPGTQCEWCKMDEARGYDDAEAEAAVEDQAALDAIYARNTKTAKAAALASWISNSIGFEFHVLDRDGLNAADPALADCIRRAIETAPAC